MHMAGWKVAGLAGVNDDHRPALTPQLQGRSESGGRSADDRNVAVPFDGAGCVISHDFYGTVDSGFRN
jgi:hypothetical protein